MKNKENKETNTKYRDIHIVEEKYNFSQKERKVQSILKILLVLILVAGLLGLFGGGLLSQRVASGSDFSVKYHQFIREESPTKLYVYLDNPSDTTLISFNSSYLEEVQIVQTMPAPLSSKTTDGRIFYSFNTAATGLIVFYLLADNAGFMELSLTVDNETKRLDQFAYF